MRLLVLGATGATGRLLTTLALDAGHSVRALVRDPDRAELPEQAEIVRGDARKVLDITSAASGVDLIVSALGMGLGTTADGLMIEATRAMIAAVPMTRQNRIVVLSSWGVGDTLRRSSCIMRLIYRPGRDVHDEKAQAEQQLRASASAWTLVYPVALTHGAATDRVRARDLENVHRMRGLPRISRADVARSMLDLVESGAGVRRTIVLDVPRQQRRG